MQRYIAPIIAAGAILGGCGTENRIESPNITVSTSAAVTAWRLEKYENQPTRATEELVYSYDDSGLKCSWDLSDCDLEFDTDYVVRVADDQPIERAFGTVAIDASTGNFETLFPPRMIVPASEIGTFRDDDDAVLTEYRLSTYYNLIIQGSEESGDAHTVSCTVPYDRESRAQIQQASAAHSATYSEYRQELVLYDESGNDYLSFSCTS